MSRMAVVGLRYISECRAARRPVGTPVCIVFVGVLAGKRPQLARSELKFAAFERKHLRILVGTLVDNFVECKSADSQVDIRLGIVLWLSSAPKFARNPDFEKSTPLPCMPARISAYRPQYKLFVLAIEWEAEALMLLAFAAAPAHMKVRTLVDKRRYTVRRFRQEQQRLA